MALCASAYDDVSYVTLVSTVNHTSLLLEVQIAYCDAPTMVLYQLVSKTSLNQSDGYEYSSAIPHIFLNAYLVQRVTSVSVDDLFNQGDVTLPAF